MANPFSATLGTSLRAGYPILYLVTAEEDRMGLNRSQTMHGAFDIFSAPGEAQPEQEPQPGPQFAAGRGSGGGAPPPEGPVRRAPVVRSMPAVGRNAPCPCGSGKKYKKCHGATA